MSWAGDGSANAPSKPHPSLWSGLEEQEQVQCFHAALVGDSLGLVASRGSAHLKHALAFASVRSRRFARRQQLCVAEEAASRALRFCVPNSVAPLRRARDLFALKEIMTKWRPPAIALLHGWSVPQHWMNQH